MSPIELLKKFVEIDRNSQMILIVASLLALLFAGILVFQTRQKKRRDISKTTVNTSTVTLSKEKTETSLLLPHDVNETDGEIQVVRPCYPSSEESAIPNSEHKAALPGYATTFKPLSEGALLRQGRYAIREIRHSSEQLNVYLIEDLIPARRCQHCNTVIVDAQEPFCTACGADLSSVQPVNLRYLVEETPNGQKFTLESWLIGRALQHPGLLLPKDIFTESPYGTERQYRVIPEFPLPVATDMSVPQELNTVLAWGIELAQALEHLHRYQIAFREIGLSHIVVDQQKAFWTNLNQAYLIPPESRGTREQIFAYNIQGLARILLHLVTGQDTKVENVGLPESLKALLEQAVNTSSGLTTTTFAARLAEILQELRRPNNVLFAIGCRTDVGQVRSLNEDSLLTLNVTPIFRSTSYPVGVFVVADGMGGHEAGDVASQLVMRTIGQQAVHAIYEPVMADQPLPNIKEWLTNVTLAANQIVYEQRKAAQNDMGTTLVMALIAGDMATLVNVGDSRCYHLNMTGITQVTTDHSLVERMVATGQITREEAAQHPQKNVVYRVMGDKPKLVVDIYEKRLAEGEALLLCSDGLSGMVSDKHIWDTWRTSTSPQEACDRLVNAANQAGGEDNITVIIVQILQ